MIQVEKAQERNHFVRLRLLRSLGGSSTCHRVGFDRCGRVGISWLRHPGFSGISDSRDHRFLDF